jgi:hypothetical protein
MKTLALKFVFLCCALLIFTDSASACLCRPGSPKQAFARAKKSASVVFAGQAVEVVNGFSSGQFRGWRVTFKVNKSWKGEPGQEVVVFTGPDDCAAYFEVGKEYLVFAIANTEHQLQTNVCIQTGLLSRGAENLKRLGKGKDVNSGGAAFPITGSITKPCSCRREACFSSDLIPSGLNADRAPQLKASVISLRRRYESETAKLKGASDSAVAGAG